MWCTAWRDLVAGEIAAGRNPKLLLQTMVETSTKSVETINRWSERFVASRIDVDPNTIKNYKTALKKIGATFGDRDPASITVDDVASWMSDIASKLKPEHASCTCSFSGCCSTTSASSRTRAVTPG
jgi:uncharacterized Ntn-hydrolase superfamily protein